MFGEGFLEWVFGYDRIRFYIHANLPWFNSADFRMEAY